MLISWYVNDLVLHVVGYCAYDVHKTKRTYLCTLVSWYLILIYTYLIITAMQYIPIGWTFDGKSGQCMEIPQTLISQGNKPPTQRQTSNQKRRREDATAVATTVVQGMVWIQPNYTPLEALAAMNNGTLLSPPTIPEMDMEGYKSTRAIRDFPIDWTVLTENILDPGKSVCLFYHVNSTVQYEVSMV